MSENNVSFPALYVAVGADQNWIAARYTQVIFAWAALIVSVALGAFRYESWLQKTLLVSELAIMWFTIALAFALVLVLGFLTSRFTLARSGLAQFSAEGVEIEKPRGYDVPPHRVRLRWQELRAYRDPSSDFVELLRPGDRIARRKLTVPTPNEETRTAVLHLLDGHGIPREE